MPEQDGRVIIVTGGNSGLGYESVKAFALKGAGVVSACRSVTDGKKAKKEIQDIFPEVQIEVMELDLADLESVRKFAGRFRKKYKRLDILMNNAGIMTTPYFHTKDGLEGQNGTNYFGHFALTGHLMDLLKDTPGSRVVNVSSNAHKFGKMNWENLLFKNGEGYTPMRAYARSKLANLLFTYELQRRFIDNFIDCNALAAHPGSSHTNLTRYMEKMWWYRFARPVVARITQDQSMGALPQIRAAADPNAIGGEYYGPDGFMELKGFPVAVSPDKAAGNRPDAKTLWKVSEEITGIKYL